jgi:hypothetical protein
MQDLLDLPGLDDLPIIHCPLVFSARLRPSHVSSVTQLSWSVSEYYGRSSLDIEVSGSVISPGWQQPFLKPRYYNGTDPEEGYWEFDFLSLPPAETVIQRRTPVSACLEWQGYHDCRATLRGIIIIAGHNRIEVAIKKPVGEFFPLPGKNFFLTS